MADELSPVVGPQSQSYRRGFVLGQTLAELMTLILFVLLLILGVHEVKQKFAMDKQKAEYAALVKALGDKAGLASALREAQDSIRQLEKVVKEQKAAIASLAPDLKNFRELLEGAKIAPTSQGLANLIKENENFHALLKKAGSPPTPEGLAQMLKESKERSPAELAALGELKEALERAGIQPSAEALSRLAEDAAALKQLMDKAGVKTSKGLASEFDRMHDQIKTAAEDLKSCGKGYPSCWDDKGQTEYIYDVTLHSGGITMVETDLPRRSADRKNLPTDAIRLNEILSNRDFLSSTRPLYEWSENKQCRFFVRVEDDTLINEKAVYKDRLKTVERHFYKLLVGEPQ